MLIQYLQNKKIRPVYFFVLAACVLGGIFFFGRLGLDVLRVQRMKQNLQDMLAATELLSEITDKQHCVLRKSRSVKSPSLLIVGPEKHDWLVLTRERGRLRLERVNDLQTARVKTRRYPRRSDSAETFRIYRSGNTFHIPVPGKKPLRVKCPSGWQIRFGETKRPDKTTGWKTTALVNSLKKDDFMRKKFGNGDGWTVESGSFATVARGGGKSKTANPFILRASTPSNGNVIASAKTGWPVSGNYSTRVNVRGASPHATYTLQAGGSRGSAVAVKWDGTQKKWHVLLKQPNGNSRTLIQRKVAVPGKNWARPEITLHSPFSATVRLDRVRLGRFHFKNPVYGPVRLQVASGKAHFDDFYLGPEQRRESRKWTRLHMKSRRFARKPVKSMKKDRDFIKWARDTAGFSTAKFRYKDTLYHGLRYSAPIYGAFSYKGLPAGNRPLLLRIQGNNDESRHVLFRYNSADGWHRTPPADNTGRQKAESKEGQQTASRSADAGELHFRYRRGQLYLPGTSTTLPVAADIPRPVHLTLAVHGTKPDPENHVLRSANLWNEFFSDSPADWCAWTGRFGMLTRWHCEPYWNWMGIYSRHLASLFSRYAYRGNQTIDFYAAFKDTVQQAKGVDRRYVRANMNFSFCTNGREPGSGYTLLFGGFGNTGTFLLKNGRILAKNQRIQIPEWPGNEHDIHWRWWHFKITKRDGDITVFIDDKKILHARDPEPLTGGHTGLWTVRNGLLISRLRIAAEQRVWRPQRFWISPPSETDDKFPWQPLKPGRVTVRRKSDTNRYEVTNRIGGGTFAVKWTGEPVDLSKTPILKLPFDAGDHARINLHLQVSGHSYLLPVNAPVKNTASILTPRARSRPDKNVFLRFAQHKMIPDKKVLPAAEIRNNLLKIDLMKALANTKAGQKPHPRLESLMIGNTSNHQYLLGGFKNNGKGTTYTIGQPSWRGR